MANPTITLRNVEETLHSVILSLMHAQKGFQKLGENMKSKMVRRYFMAESLKRAEFRGALETMLHQEGMHDIVEDLKGSGAAYPAWTGLQTILQGRDHAILVTAEQAERETLQSYIEALANDDLPLPARKLLSAQSKHIEGALECVRAMCDCSR
jgi:hypothetical protein